MTLNQYLEEIMRRLALPKATKKRIRQDLEQDIQSAIEHGETLEQAIQRIGRPEDVARDFNESLAAPAASLSGKQKAAKVFLIIVIVLCSLSLISTGMGFSFLFSLFYESKYWHHRRGGRPDRYFCHSQLFPDRRRQHTASHYFPYYFRLGLKAYFQDKKIAANPALSLHLKEGRGFQLTRSKSFFKRSIIRFSSLEIYDCEIPRVSATSFWVCSLPL